MNPMASEFEWRSLEPGTSIVVEEAPFDGVPGTVLGVDEDDRVIVSVMLLRGAIAITLDPTAVRIERQIPPAPLRAH